VSANKGYSEALRADGILWRWAGSSLGFPLRSPWPVAPEARWKSVAGHGAGQSLALRKDGTLWGWGNNGQGQLGDGTTSTRSPHAPAGILLDQRWLAVDTSEDHTVALRADGTLWTWGGIIRGTLGDGTAGVQVPDPVPIEPGARWQAVAAGGGHTAALRADGTLWAWGFNGQGQLGDGTFENRLVPTRLLPEERWQSVMAGYAQTLALRSDGSLWGWGENGYQLADMPGGPRVLPGVRPSPVMIQPAGTWLMAAAGAEHVLAIRGNGTLWAWGRDGSGQLGVTPPGQTWIDGTGGRVAPTAVQPSARWKVVAAGGAHSLALRTDGTLWAWGYNSSGAVGDGTTEHRRWPTPIQPNERWQAIAPGYAHSVAIRTNGTLWAWGDNRGGQLGDGTTTERRTPVPILPGERWQSVLAASDITLALRADGTLWQWGGWVNPSPVMIHPDHRWRTVATGGGHFLGLKEDGTLWGWGSNPTGQLGIPPWRQVLGGAVWGLAEP
jgi:alpha-tubulin suppressor-like RCC1 family protein